MLNFHRQKLMINECTELIFKKLKNIVISIQHLRITLFPNLVKIIHKSLLLYILEDFCSLILYQNLEIGIHITWEHCGTLNHILSTGDIL